MMSFLVFSLIALGYLWIAVKANNKVERQLRGMRLSKGSFTRPKWFFKDALFIVMVVPPLLYFAVLAFAH